MAPILKPVIHFEACTFLHHLVVNATHTHPSEDKVSNPSKAGSKPEEPTQGDSGVS
jgi:hypothetical protein